MLAGPNGAGKSTYAARVLQPTSHLPFVNADVLAAEGWPQDPGRYAYEAARLAALTRRDLLTDRRSFITETVFSHPSKNELVDDALRLGYIVHLHVLLVPVELSIARVAERVRRGGHDVPEIKIRERHERLWALLARARDRADRTDVLDNSRADRPFRLVASYQQGRLIGGADWPAWTPAALRS